MCDVVESFVNQGMLKGQIKVFIEDLKLAPSEIAKRLNISEEKVKTIIDSL